MLPQLTVTSEIPIYANDTLFCPLWDILGFFSIYRWYHANDLLRITKRSINGMVWTANLLHTIVATYPTEMLGSTEDESQFKLSARHWSLWSVLNLEHVPIQVPNLTGSWSISCFTKSESELKKESQLLQIACSALNAFIPNIA